MRVPDLHEFEELSRRAPRKCVVARRLSEVSPEDSEQLDAALKATHISHNAISTWLAKRGLRCGDGSIKKHRDGDCCCER